MTKPEMMFVRPAAGRTVLSPRSNLQMPAEGMPVHVHDPHWMALLRFGDIEITDAPAAPEEDTAVASPAHEAVPAEPSLEATASEPAHT